MSLKPRMPCSESLTPAPSCHRPCFPPWQWASPVAQTVKRLPAMWETWVQSLGWEDPLEKEGKIPTPVLLPGKFHGQRSLVGPSPWGRKESATSERLHCPSMPGDQVQLFFLGRAFIPLLPTRVPGLLHQQKLIRDQTSNSGNTSFR